MISLLEELGKKNPRYSMKHRKLIDSLARKGARDYHESSEDVYELGKFFNSFYEFYIYAAFIGLYQNNPVPLYKEHKTNTFSVPMRDWVANNAFTSVQYLWMSAIVKSGIDLNKMEEMEDEEAAKEIIKIKDLIEAYANGGFEYISSLAEENPAFFEDDDCFVKLLNTINNG
ncbi:MAG: hypothetical protein ACOCQD_02865 [archaeon]